MSIHAEIRIDNFDGTFTFVYVHFDGYPKHMLPALQAHQDALGSEEFDERLIAAREIRSVDRNEIDAFDDARHPRISEDPKGREQYAYARNDEDKWELVK